MSFVYFGLWCHTYINLKLFHKLLFYRFLSAVEPSGKYGLHTHLANCKNNLERFAFTKYLSILRHV